jgi:hypothetical protein
MWALEIIATYALSASRCRGRCYPRGASASVALSTSPPAKCHACSREYLPAVPDRFPRFHSIVVRCIGVGPVTTFALSEFISTRLPDSAEINPQLEQCRRSQPSESRTSEALVSGAQSP